MYDVHLAIDIASHGAGKSDDGWNKRFVSMLRILGYDIVAETPNLKGQYLMAPVPLDKGWKYDYPSYIVPQHRTVAHD